MYKQHDPEPEETQGTQEPSDNLFAMVDRILTYGTRLDILW